MQTAGIGYPGFFYGWTKNLNFLSDATLHQMMFCHLPNMKRMREP